MNILQKLEQQALPIHAQLQEPGKPLPYVSYQHLLKPNGETSLIVKAECGTGKTFALAELVKQGLKVLYVSHRIALNEENKDEFTDTTCINSIHRYDLNDYDFVVFDEWTAMSSGFDWKQLNLRLISDAVSDCQSSMVFIDRDCTEESIEEIKAFTGREHFDYLEHETGSRQKAILLTRNKQEFFDLLLNSGHGIKLVCTDNANEAIKLAGKDWGQKAFDITSKSTETVSEIIAKAKEAGNCVIFTSPKVQEGVSLVGEEFIFNGYIWFSHKGIKLPAKKVYQACMRCRDSKVMRAVLLSPKGKVERPAEVDPEDLFLDFLEATGKLREYIKNGGVCADWYRPTYYSIYANRVKQTRIDLENMTEAVTREFEDGGFFVMESKKKAGKKYTLKDRVKPSDFPSWVTKEMLTVSPERRAVLLKLKDRLVCETSNFNSLPLPLNPADIKYTPNPEGKEKIIAQLEHSKIMARVHNSRQTKLFAYRLNELVNEEDLLSVNERASEIMQLYWSVFAQLTNPLMYLVGQDLAIVKSKLLVLPEFIELKERTGNKDKKQDQWFSNICEGHFGLNIKSVGGRTPKYIVTNNLKKKFTKEDLLGMYRSYPGAYTKEQYVEAGKALGL